MQTNTLRRVTSSVILHSFYTVRCHHWSFPIHGTREDPEKCFSLGLPREKKWFLPQTVWGVDQILQQHLCRSLLWVRETTRHPLICAQWEWVMSRFFLKRQREVETETKGRKRHWWIWGEEKESTGVKYLILCLSLMAQEPHGIEGKAKIWARYDESRDREPLASPCTAYTHTHADAHGHEKPSHPLTARLRHWVLFFFSFLSALLSFFLPFFSAYQHQVNI